MGKNSDKKDKKKNIKKIQKTHKTSVKQKAVGQQLTNQHKVKSTAYIIAYDSKNHIILEGGLSKISKDLKISKKDLLKTLDSGYESKSFQLFRFNDAEERVRFKDILNKKEKGASASAKKKESARTLNRVRDGYKVVKTQSTDNKFWGTKKNAFKIKITGEISDTDIKDVLEDVITKTKNGENLKKTDKMRLILTHPFLEHPISTKLVDASEMNIDLIIENLLDSVVSYEGFEFTSDTEIIMESLVLPIGGAVNTKKYILKDQIKKNKTAIITIDNIKDQMCMARALFVGLWRQQHHDKIVRKSKIKNIEHTNEWGLEWERVRRSESPFQYEQAKLLCENAGVSPTDPCGIDEVKLFQEYISDYQISILDIDDGCNTIFPDVNSEDYVPPYDLNDCIYILKDGDHYHHINHKFLGGLLDKHYFCHRCKKTYGHKEKHKCKFKCNMCMATDCDSIGLKYKDRLQLQCLDCKRFFPTEMCLKNHKIPNSKGISVCDKLWKCPVCRVRMDPQKFPIDTHICGDYWCHNCNELVRKDHQCYMFPKKYKDWSEKYIFFDFETHIDFNKEGRTNHQVMYAVSQYFHSPEGEYVYHTSIEDWCKWAICEEHTDYTFIAHNGQGYDFVFILKWVINNTNEVPHTINNGRKIMYMSIDAFRLRFVDSLNFIAGRLADFPKMFGFTELRKGFYPHMFNTPENINYVGEMPSIDLFEVNHKKKAEYDEIMKWYKEKCGYVYEKKKKKWSDKPLHKPYIWDNLKEMRKYCESDVDILAKAMKEFRKLYLKIADIDPLRYLTIASVCMAIFRYEFLDTSFPERMEDSFMGNPKEIFAETKEIVFNEKKIAVFNDKEQIDWMRQSFFGGRTNALKLLYNFKGNEVGRYVDITSLYPTCQYYDDFPKGHMKIIEGPDITNEHIEKIEKGEIYGIIECTLFPPNDLYIPVLPKKGSKLVFDLTVQKGRWCSNEIKMALEMGYELHRVKKIYHWEECSNSLFRKYVEKFLKIKQEASGYPEWVFENKDDVGKAVIEARKDKYIEDYFNSMGIKLDKSKIVYNEGLRAVAKLCLNSLWGKFGQRINLGEVKIINNKAALYEIITNETNDNIKWIELDTTNDEGEILQHKLQVSWTKKDEYIKNDFTTNIALATFTTANARMRLYKGLRHLNHQVLYFDTDSIIYVYDKSNKKKNKELILGDNLGDWTDELKGLKMVGCFASGGPKNYSYQTENLECHTKVKGFRLSVGATSNQYKDDGDGGRNIIKRGINHKNIIGAVMYKYINKDDENSKIFMGGEYDQFIRTDTKDITNKIVKKEYGVVYDKRHVLKADKKGNLDTLPFGHKDEPSDDEDEDS